MPEKAKSKLQGRGVGGPAVAKLFSAKKVADTLRLTKEG